jgi:hypothetical protein
MKMRTMHRGEGGMMRCHGFTTEKALPSKEFTPDKNDIKLSTLLTYYGPKSQKLTELYLIHYMNES